MKGLMVPLLVLMMTGNVVGQQSSPESTNGPSRSRLLPPQPDNSVDPSLTASTETLQQKMQPLSEQELPLEVEFTQDLIDALQLGRKLTLPFEAVDETGQQYKKQTISGISAVWGGNASLNNLPSVELKAERATNEQGESVLSVPITRSQLARLEDSRLVYNLPVWERDYDWVEFFLERSGTPATNESSASNNLGSRGFEPVPGPGDRGFMGPERPAGWERSGSFQDEFNSGSRVTSRNDQSLGGTGLDLGGGPRDRQQDFRRRESQSELEMAKLKDKLDNLTQQNAALLRQSNRQQNFRGLGGNDASRVSPDLTPIRNGSTDDSRFADRRSAFDGNGGSTGLGSGGMSLLELDRQKARLEENHQAVLQQKEFVDRRDAELDDREESLKQYERLLAEKASQINARSNSSSLPQVRPVGYQDSGVGPRVASANSDFTDRDPGTVNPDLNSAKNTQGDLAQNNTKPTGADGTNPNTNTNPKSVMPLYALLWLSLGGNLYLALLCRQFYARYGELADELRETFTTTM